MKIYVYKFYFQWGRQDSASLHGCLDTGFYYVNKALALYGNDNYSAPPRDDNYYYALNLIAVYYLHLGKYELADQYRRDSEKGIFSTYVQYQNDLVCYSEMNAYYNAIESYQLYLGSKPEDLIIPGWIHLRMYDMYRGAGFAELARKHSEKLLMMDEDSSAHMARLWMIEWAQGNYSAALGWARRFVASDPGGPWDFIYLLWPHIWRDYQEAARITLEGLERLAMEGLQP